MIFVDGGSLERWDLVTDESMSLQTYDYAKQNYYWRQHHSRFAHFVNGRKLVCQDCGGWGGETVPILDYGQGPWEPCEWCEGTGYVTPWLRGYWLRWKAQHKS